jgi:hypothetical protein
MGNRSRLGWLILLSTVALAGCSGTTKASSPPSSTTTIVTPTTTTVTSTPTQRPTATPKPVPTVMTIAQARAFYLADVAQDDKACSQLNSLGSKGSTNLGLLRPAARECAAGQWAFAARLRSVKWPAVAASDVAALSSDIVDEQDYWTQASQARSLTDFMNEVNAPSQSYKAANHVRADLGLPPAQ